MVLKIRSGMLILHPGYGTALHYHGSAKMLNILQLPIARAQISLKTDIQVFIKGKTARHYFKTKQNKKVRILC